MIASIARVAATVVAALAALLHVVIFVMESVQWMRPAVFARFGVRDADAARIIRPMAYNQGFYNLFLALGVLFGLVLAGAGGEMTVIDVAGRTLVFFGLGCMLAAALILLSTGRRYLRAAALQGTLPLLGIVLWIVA